MPSLMAQETCVPQAHLKGHVVLKIFLVGALKDYRFYYWEDYSVMTLLVRQILVIVIVVH